VKLEGGRSEERMCIVKKTIEDGAGAITILFMVVRAEPHMVPVDGLPGQFGRRE
jgi:hypothetical protein